MRRRAKASSARSAPGQGSRLDSVRSASPTAPVDPTGIGAPSSSRRRAFALSATGLLVLLSILLPCTRAFADTSFGEEGNEAGRFSGGEPEGIAVESKSGDLYIPAGYAHRVDKFEANGNSLFAFGWGSANGAEEEQTCTVTCDRSPFTGNAVTGAMLAEGSGVAVDPTSGDVYVVDREYDRVMKFSPSGEFLLAFGGDVVAYGANNSTNNERQKVTVTAEGGTFEILVHYPFSQAYSEAPSGRTTPLPYDASDAEVEAAVDALPTVGGLGGSVSVTGGPGNAAGSTPYEITFEGKLGGDHIVRFEAEDGESEPLTGADSSLTTELVHEGGGPEVCKPAAGDRCKMGGDFTSGAPGTFSKWPEHYGVSQSLDLIAVDPTSGDVYVGDKDRVEKFSPEGAYVGQINLDGRRVGRSRCCRWLWPPLRDQ